MKRAFTLIELSIVLIIIGLLVGGVLVGRDLIEAANTRKLITDVDNIKRAIYTFYAKYDGYPGDLDNAIDFWGEDASCPNTPSNSTPKMATCDGNGNGRLGATNITEETENLRVWQHLANAGMIEGSYTGVTGSASVRDANTLNTPTTVNDAFYWIGSHIITSSADWFFVEGGRVNRLVIGSRRDGDGSIHRPAFTPLMTFNVDSKVDDGRPGLGSILAPKLNSVNSPNCSSTDLESTSEYLVQNDEKTCWIEFLDIF